MVVETPKGCRNKYSYDIETGCFELGFELPEGMLFPFDFGFVPSTLADDGDPLDVLILLDAPAMPGCIVRARLIGVIEARQKESGRKWIRNDRLVAIATHARAHQDVDTIETLKPHVLQDIKAFFVDYNKLRGRLFECLAERGPKHAEKLVKKATKRFRNGG